MYLEIYKYLVYRCAYLTFLYSKQKTILNLVIIGQLKMNSSSNNNETVEITTSYMIRVNARNILVLYDLEKFSYSLLYVLSTN